MKVCALVINYFGYEDTKACISQISRQTVEAIYVLDNSADCDEFENLKNALENQNSVSIIQTEKNLGFAAGVNHALRKILPCDFDVYIILNSDIIITSNSIETMLKGMAENRIDIASPLINRYPDQSQLWSRGNFYNSWTGLITKRRLPLPGNSFYVTGCCMAVRKTVFEDAGLLDEDFFMYGEDVEFCSRAKQQGFQIGVIPEALIYHKVGSSSIPNSPFYELHISRGHLLLCNKLIQGPVQQKISLGIKFIMLTVRALIRAVRHNNFIAVKGMILAIKSL